MESKKKIKKAVRIMAFKNSEEPTRPLFKEFNILPLESFIDFRYGKFFWKLMNNELPESLKSVFRFNERTLFTVQNPRLELNQRFVTYSGMKIWNNDIPTSIKSKKSFKSFSKSYYKFLNDSL